MCGIMEKNAKLQQLSRVLVVEDDKSQLQTLMDIMEQEGFEVLGCSRASEALKHLTRMNTGVVVLDLHLPDLSGTQLLQRLNANGDKIRVIIYTAYSSYESAKDALNLGAFAYVEKSRDPEEIISYVHRASEAGLRSYAEDLEKAVADRTGKLSVANRALKQEIVERKQAEKRRQRLTEVLLEKNRELEEIIRVATHDMRTPMVNIVGFSRILGICCEQIRLLTEKQKNPAASRKQLDEVIEVDIPEAVGIINSGVSKMKSLLDGLLRLAKVGYSATGIVQLDMNAEIENIIDAIRFQVEQSGAEIKVEPLPSCLGDKSQINQVFSNLFANALKYLDQSRPGQVRISGHTEKDYSVYCVQDNGVGIKANNIEDIFKMSYRVRPADDTGEGLGLAIVRRIVNRHNGEVWAESEAGKGSKFFVKLPRQ